MSIGLPKGMSRDDAYIQGIADTEERVGNASRGLYDALMVVTHDPIIRPWLQAFDPKALEQAEQALEAYKATGAFDD